jgi:hypothetical protein
VALHFILLKFSLIRTDLGDRGREKLLFQTTKLDLTDLNRSSAVADDAQGMAAT